MKSQSLDADGQPLLSQPDAAVSVLDVGKMYRIYDQPQDRLKQMLFARFGKNYGREFWALRGVSFEVSRGQRVGIIGRNGSGKSTLLQIIAGTLASTEGTVRVSGRVAALLELGSGFNPEFTGRQNVFVNGTILGLPRQEVERRFDQIAAFADIGDFMDQPVKFYSSGMFVRLGFAVATSVDADVLLVDEALAVGDVFFTQKCYRRLAEVIAKGVAIVLVTHDMSAVSQFCDTTLVLERGQPVFWGNPVDGIRRYFALQRGHTTHVVRNVTDYRTDESVRKTIADENFAWPREDAFLSLKEIIVEGTGVARCTAIAICDGAGNPCNFFQIGERACFYYEFLAEAEIDVPIGGVTVLSDKNIIIHGKNSLQYGLKAPGRIPKGTLLRFRQSIVLDISPGQYTFLVGLATIDAASYANAQDMSYPDLSERIRRVVSVGRAGTFVVGFKQTGQALTHHGLCNLSGECAMTLINAGN
jgi:lipopolysaccharide transport system ATP-binding protein